MYVCLYVCVCVYVLCGCVCVCAVCQACEALRDALLVLGPGIDGGKDSLSMAAQVQG